MDNKKLNKLIEQVLEEKYSRDLAGLDWNELKKQIQLSGNLKKDFGAENGAAAVAKINQIAALEKGKDTLEDEDFLEVYVKQVKDLIPFLDAIAKNTSDPRLQDTIKAARDKAEQLLTQKLGSDFKRATTAPEPYPFGQMGKVYTPGTVTDESTSNWKDWDKIKDSLGTVDPILDDLFQSIEGDTVVQKWANILNFAEKAMEGADGLDEWYTTKGGGNEFKLMNYALVLSLMADTPKLSDTSNAGNFFEGFLAYLLNAPVAGKAGRAIDNLTKLANGNMVYMSAKYYTSLSSVSQKYANLQADTYEFDDIYYFTMVKESTLARTSTISTGSKFNQLDLYITRITGEGGTKNLKGKLSGTKGSKIIKAQEINAKGEPVGQKWVVDKDGELYRNAPETNKPAFSIPVLNLTPAKDLTTKQLEELLSAFTANYLSQELEKSNQKRAAAVTVVLKQLAAMDQKIKGYTGAKGNIKDTAANPGQRAGEAKQYMLDLYDSYKKTTQGYQDVFKYDATTGTGEKGEKFKDIEFKESKSPLDQLIEAIVKEKLLK